MESSESHIINEPEKYIKFEQMISYLSARFILLTSHQVDDEIELALEKVLEFFQVDRCGLLQALPDENAWEITHVAYSEYGGTVPRGTRLSRSINPWAYDQVVIKKQVVAFESISDLTDAAEVDRQTWIDWEIRSNLVIPVLSCQSKIYVIAINAVQKECVWPQEYIPRLRLLGEIFVAALERRMAEQALKKNAARLSLAVDSAEAGLWELNCGTGIFWVSDQARLIFGFGPEEVVSMGRFEALIHQNDLGPVQHAIARALNEKEPIDVEFRIYCIGGRVKWIASKGRPYFRLNGEPDRLMGASIDISKRKQMEQDLKHRLKEIERLKHQLENENLYLREELKIEQGFERIIGDSKELKSVLFAVKQVAPTDATVLLLGETGTGKGMIAHAVHQMSARKDRPLITVNCAALPNNLIESELFGREKGAFTGAHARQSGRFQVADGGTIFLDEIGELPLELQSKLLRVLQDGEFERLGSARTIKINVRVIAATSRDLIQEIREKRFREDLFYRLKVFPITIPPLRQRTEDIPLLVQYFTAKYARKMGKQVDLVSKSLITKLQQYDWPGNVRELEYMIERGVVISSGQKLTITDPLEPSKPTKTKHESLKDLQSTEREHILKVLRETGWRIEGSSGAASILKLHPSTLRFRIKKLGIRRPI